jgi:hypothetical protein
MCADVTVQDLVGSWEVEIVKLLERLFDLRRPVYPQQGRRAESGYKEKTHYKSSIMQSWRLPEGLKWNPQAFGRAQPPKGFKDIPAYLMNRTINQ